MTVHTYPEYHPDTCLATFRVDIDVATCGEITPLSTLDYLIGSFDSDIITMDYRVRGFTRDVAGKKLFMDHKITSIQDYIDTETLQRYDAVILTYTRLTCSTPKCSLRKSTCKTICLTRRLRAAAQNPPGHHRQPAEGNDRGVQRQQHLLRPSRASVFVYAADQETGPAAAEAERLESVRRRTPRRKGGTAPAKKRGAALSGKKIRPFYAAFRLEDESKTGSLFRRNLYMIVYWIVAVCLILNLVNPRLLWYIDAWKYKDSKKEEPSSAYIILSRSISAIGLIVLATLYFTRYPL